MNAYQALVEAWTSNLERMSRSKAFQLVSSGTITRRQYASILRQIFHQARENPQIQALATVRFRGDQRDAIKSFYRHAISEIGHDELALRDIEALGEDLGGIRSERPLPATLAVTASVIYMIEHLDPVGYLGYLFHLEYTPTMLGSGYIEALKLAGIPENAMEFLREHASVDVAHCKLIQQYCEKLIRTPEQLDAALYMQRVTSELYTKMLEQAIDSADDWDRLTGPNPIERNHRREPVGEPISA